MNIWRKKNILKTLVHHVARIEKKKDTIFEYKYGPCINYEKIGQTYKL
jgi:hypothetical protein